MTPSRARLANRRLLCVLHERTADVPVGRPRERPRAPSRTSFVFLVLVRAMHNSQTLLSWAHSIYDWLIASSAPRGGSGGLAASRDVLRVRYALHGSLVELVTAWPGLVPLDQEDIVDCLLRAACAAASTGHFDAIAVRARVRKVTSLTF